MYEKKDEWMREKLCGLKGEWIVIMLDGLMDL